MKNLRKYIARLDILKGVACFCVVMLHCTFPGVIGKVIYGIARFAVPLFFAISGFYLYSSDYNVIEKKIPRRFFHILKLFILTELLYFCWHIVEAILKSGSLYSAVVWIKDAFSALNILLFVCLQKTFIGDVSWFLMALLLCYGISYYINQFKLWKKSFTFIPILLFINVLVGEVSPFFLSVKIQWYYVSNFWQLGLPCFLLGAWMNDHQEDLLKISDRRLFYTVICSVALNIIERIATSASQFFISNIPFMVACMVACLKHPDMHRKNSWGGTAIHRSNSFIWNLYSASYN